MIPKKTHPSFLYIDYTEINTLQIYSKTLSRMQTAYTTFNYYPFLSILHLLQTKTTFALSLFCFFRFINSNYRFQVPYCAQLQVSNSSCFAHR